MGHVRHTAAAVVISGLTVTSAFADSAGELAADTLDLSRDVQSTLTADGRVNEVMPISSNCGYLLAGSTMDAHINFCIGAMEAVEPPVTVEVELLRERYNDLIGRTDRADELVSTEYNDYVRADITQYPHYHSPSFAADIDANLTAACPDPTPSLSDPELQVCIDGISQAASDIAVRVSDFINENTTLDVQLLDTAEQSLLLSCAAQVNQTQRLPFEGAETAYAEFGIGTAASCIQLINTAEDLYGAFIDTPAQEHVINSINCAIDPNDCQRPFAPGLE